MQGGHQDVSSYLEDYQTAGITKATLKSSPLQSLSLKNLAFVACNKIWL